MSIRSICFSLFDGDILRSCRIRSLLAPHQRNLLLILLILFLAPDLHALTLDQTQRNSTHALDTIPKFCNLSRKKIDLVYEPLVHVLKIRLFTLFGLQYGLDITRDLLQIRFYSPIDVFGYLIDGLFALLTALAYLFEHFFFDFCQICS